MEEVMTVVGGLLRLLHKFASLGVLSHSPNVRFAPKAGMRSDKISNYIHTPQYAPNVALSF